MRPAVLMFALLLPLPGICSEDRAPAFPGVKSLMSAEEYRAAGLEKLSPEEVNTLNQWLERYTSGPVSAVREAVVPPPPPPATEQKKPEKDPDSFTARVLPPFTGWSGATRFHLDNGQVWQQRLSGRFTYRGDETEVLIRKNFLGFYVMEHIASGETIGIKKSN